MVEMAETASILNQATSRSLILLDEIGRGTSTYDGISIAWAVVEYLLRNIKENPRTLFATHYYELTALENEYSALKNMNVAVSEEESGVRFLYKVIPGKTDRSYGIFVAKLAGLPAHVIQRAETILVQLEQQKRGKKLSQSFQPELFTLSKNNVNNQKENLACYDFLKNLDLVKTSPLECFTKLIKFKSTLA
jgi:DNA mismatch repair protein MutS